MTFSVEERALFERRYNGIRARTECLQDRPAGTAYTIEKYPFFWERINRLAAMSREELMNEIMADYMLLGCSFED